ncbi:MAG: peptide-methionine (S)-S-oxide reductase [Candidatus Margulisbacteria bacterium GWF2_38_17]|nr:MAG: peptide-methionine (S)-S-oxide reductase [Candidatus Margulisbacteria bacterium GWD2_39_127]OGI01466.1 MAG: peptide-methionine (S)-S-oxide reductase [Candidatus Margulisbacteria bacterium GWF2_38_17]OGI10722.1 MAG: peptide-methionine (S)-S-oxide reductase [Candidatus Margulisbacteria bacterium GWE2_39_32]
MPPIDLPTPSKKKNASFSMGCFWDSDARFGIKAGIISTRVGYTGGTSLNPAYHDIGDHIESVLLVYDPEIVTYQELLTTFWKGHNPTIPQERQYSSAIYFHDEDQRQLAFETKKRLQDDTFQGQIHTELITAGQFFTAESHHQKYYLKRYPDIMLDFSIMYPSDKDFINSTAAARINSYIGGFGSYRTLQYEIDSFGLSPTAMQKLIEIVRDWETQKAA